MAAIAAGNIRVYEQDVGPGRHEDSPFGVKEILVETIATADDTDTIAVTLANYGITSLLYVKGFTHTTDNDAIIVEAPTTAVSAGVLTITVGGSTDNKKRVFIVGGK